MDKIMRNKTAKLFLMSCLLIVCVAIVQFFSCSFFSDFNNKLGGLNKSLDNNQIYKTNSASAQENSGKLIELKTNVNKSEVFNTEYNFTNYAFYFDGVSYNESSNEKPLNFSRVYENGVQNSLSFYADNGSYASTKITPNKKELPNYIGTYAKKYYISELKFVCDGSTQIVNSSLDFKTGEVSYDKLSVEISNQIITIVYSVEDDSVYLYFGSPEQTTPISADISVEISINQKEFDLVYDKNNANISCLLDGVQYNDGKVVADQTINFGLKLPAISYFDKIVISNSSENLPEDIVLEIYGGFNNGEFTWSPSFYQDNVESEAYKIVYNNNYAIAIKGENVNLYSVYNNFDSLTMKIESKTLPDMFWEITLNSDGTLDLTKTNNTKNVVLSVSYLKFVQFDFRLRDSFSNIVLNSEAIKNITITKTVGGVDSDIYNLVSNFKTKYFVFVEDNFESVSANVELKEDYYFLNSAVIGGEISDTANGTIKWQKTFSISDINAEDFKNFIQIITASSVKYVDVSVNLFENGSEFAKFTNTSTLVYINGVSQYGTNGSFKNKFKSNSLLNIKVVLPERFQIASKFILDSEYVFVSDNADITSFVYYDDTIEFQCKTADLNINLNFDVRFFTVEKTLYSDSVVVGTMRFVFNDDNIYISTNGVDYLPLTEQNVPIKTGYNFVKIVNDTNTLIVDTNFKSDVPYNLVLLKDLKNSDSDLFVEWDAKTYVLKIITDDNSQVYGSVKYDSSELVLDSKIENPIGKTFVGFRLRSLIGEMISILNPTDPVIDGDNKFVYTLKDSKVWNYEYELFEDEIVVYCEYSNNSYNATFIGYNNGVTDPQNFSGVAKYSEFYTVSATDGYIVPIKTGYDFIGWAVQLNEEIFAVEASVDVVYADVFAYDFAEDKTFVAVFRPISKILTLYGNGGVFAEDKTFVNVNLEYDEAYNPAKILVPKYLGYAFEGFYTTADGNDILVVTKDMQLVDVLGYSDGNLWKLIENKELYARWSKVEYKLNVSYINGIDENIVDQIVYIDSPSIEISLNPIEGYHLGSITLNNAINITATENILNFLPRNFIVEDLANNELNIEVVFDINEYILSFVPVLAGNDGQTFYGEPVYYLVQHGTTEHELWKRCDRDGTVFGSSFGWVDTILTIGNANYNIGLNYGLEIKHDGHYYYFSAWTDEENKIFEINSINSFTQPIVGNMTFRSQFVNDTNVQINYHIYNGNSYIKVKTTGHLWAGGTAGSEYENKYFIVTILPNTFEVYDYLNKSWIITNWTETASSEMLVGADDLYAVDSQIIKTLTVSEYEDLLAGGEKSVFNFYAVYSEYNFNLSLNEGIFVANVKLPNDTAGNSYNNSDVKYMLVEKTLFNGLSNLIFKSNYERINYVLKNDLSKEIINSNTFDYLSKKAELLAEGDNNTYYVICFVENKINRNVYQFKIVNEIKS